MIFQLNISCNYLVGIFTLWNIGDETMFFVVEVDEYECTQYEHANDTCN